ncbi:MAG: radical SAM protein [Thermoproteus sp. AZ2]|uniref:Radical SAM protein n=1 Tax=Thermoproteus sp. AZ2 TaxID=1609232 RepID=A0ACC6V220_9CREN|nr:MAG: radical SAM protein [Thermoproteus sp. AZ2]
MYYNIARGNIARGCELCLLGAKAVIFITGLCRYRCFYCPVDRERFGRDVVYVNDVPAKTVEEVVELVASSAAVGAAITGGDPLDVVERVAAVANALKKALGKSFHIHLYTRATSLNSLAVSRLAGAVDEVRLHLISRGEVVRKERYIEALRSLGVSVGVEVPAVPGLERSIAEAINYLAERGLIEFVNINELDASEANIPSLLAMGFRVRDGHVVGSFESAKKLMELIRGVPVHICRSKSKDLFQIGARLFRDSMAEAAPAELVLDDGSVEYAEEGVHPNSPLARSIRVKVRLGGKTLES